jgi:hypothetical protein
MLDASFLRGVDQGCGRRRARPWVHSVRMATAQTTANDGSTCLTSASAVATGNVAKSTTELQRPRRSGVGRPRSGGPRRRRSWAPWVDLDRRRVEIGPEGWTPTQQPPGLTPFLRSLLRGSYFYFYLSEERKHRNLRRRNKENTLQTEDRRTGKGLRCSLLITGCPFHYKGFTIYRRPLGIVICLNYTFSVPDKPL